MLNTVKATIISSMIAMGALAAMPATANAHHIHGTGGGIHFQGNGFGFYFGNGGYYRDRWERPRYKKRFCSPHRAKRKAQRMGLRKVRIGHVNHRTIGVKGRRFGHREYIVFARAPRCPILRY